MARTLNSSLRPILYLFLLISNLVSISLAYRPGDIVPMSKAGQYHGSRTVWHDVIGRHCPIFAVNREVLIPIAKPTGFTGADPYKMEERSEIDVAGGFYVLFGSGLVMSFILAIYVLQSSQDKLARFVRETVVESNMPGGGVAKVE